MKSAALKKEIAGIFVQQIRKLMWKWSKTNLQLGK